MEDNPILKKQLSIEYAGNVDNYEPFKRTVGASPLLYKHDLHIYNDDVVSRHKRNIHEFKYLKQLLKSGKIEHKMVKHNVINTFYPSFVLQHHYQIFVPLLQKNMKDNKDLQALYQASIKHEITGAVFHDKQRWDFKQSSNQTPILDGNGLIQMDKQTYFYSSVTSPYITHAAFIVKTNTDLSLVIVEVRNKNGNFSNSVQTKDFGGTISQDYLPIGYNFSNVKPVIVLPVTIKNIQKQVQPLILKQRLLDFQHSLKDLHKSLWISIKYTTMRKQFRTLDNKKEQRSIITYQAVASRIIDAFTTFMMFSDVNCNIIQQDYYFLAYVELMKSAHHTILEQLIQLRETCGGFGYMQFSGHPGCIERVAYRSGFDENKQLQFTPKFLLISHFYISSEEAQKHYSIPMTSKKPSFIQYFGIFLTISGNMRRNRGSLSVEKYNREYLKQSALMAMFTKENNSRHDATNIHCLLLQYGIASYIIKNLTFINWELVQVEKQIFYDAVTQFKTQLLQTIAENLISLGETLELTYLRNTIVGRENSEDFYKELLDASRNNLRNSKQYVDYIRQPIIEMLVENRARL